MKNISPSILLDAKRQQNTSFTAHDCAVKRTKDVISRCKDKRCQFTQLYRSLNESPGGADSLHTVHPDMLGILKKGQSRIQQFMELMRKHEEAMPKGPLGTFDEAGDIRAAWGGLSPEFVREGASRGVRLLSFL